MTSNADAPGRHPQPLPTGFSPLVEGDPPAIGPFQLVGRIGAGGMGAVYGAVDSAGRHIAIKVIHPRYASDPAFRAQFLREVDLIRRVNAECTPAFLGAAPDAARPWLATEFVSGRTLSGHVRERGVLTGDALRSFAAGTAEALATIHAAGVVHRDVKPANVMLSPTGPKVLDFGIARASDDENTEAGVYGTPGWIAPERLDGAPATTRADIFAWGGLVVYAATGHGPFGTGDTATLIARSAAGIIDIEGVPDDLRPLVTRALSRDPADRPEAYQAFHEVLALTGAPAPVSGADAREHLRSLLSAAWTGFEAVRGAGPWIAAAGSLAFLSGAASAGAGAAGAGAAGVGAAGASAGAAGAGIGAGAAGGGGAAGSIAAGAGATAGVSKATAIVIAGVTASAVATGGWVGGRAYMGEPILPFSASEASNEQPAAHDGKKVEFRGMTIWIPDNWAVKSVQQGFSAPGEPAQGVEEWLALYPEGQKACADLEFHWSDNETGCKHVKVVGPGGLEFGGSGSGPLAPGDDDTQGQYNPGGGVTSCPKGVENVPLKGDTSDDEWKYKKRKVGSKQASYGLGPAHCIDSERAEAGDYDVRTYTQRSWLLKKAQIAVIDSYGLDALDKILADAEWGKAKTTGPQSVKFRNMTLELPGAWKVHRQRDEFVPSSGDPVTEEWLLVSTDPGNDDCKDPENWYGHYECPNFKVFGPGGIGAGFEEAELTEEKPFSPVSGRHTCDPAFGAEDSPPGEEAQTLADVGERRAFYRVWEKMCTDAPGDEPSTDGPTRYYEQRYWLLPESKILVVDDSRTQGLEDVLQKADLPA